MLQPHPAALGEIVIDVPLVMPSSRSGRSDEVTETHDRSAVGAIASHSEIAWVTADDSSDAVTAWVTGVVGADAAVARAGFVEDVDELVEVDEVGSDEEVEVVPVDPVELESVDVEPEVVVVPVSVELDPVDDDPVEVEPVDPLDPVDPVDDDPVEVEPVDPLDDDGAPTVTVWVVLVPLVVVVVVPSLDVVVVVELLVVVTGHETLCAWMTTPGPKLQLLVDEPAVDGADVDVFDVDEVGNTCTPFAPLSNTVTLETGWDEARTTLMILVVVTTGVEGVEVEGIGVDTESAGVFIALETAGDCGEAFEVPEVLVEDAESEESASDADAVVAPACAVLNPPKPTNVMMASVERMIRPPFLCQRMAGLATPEVDLRERAARAATRPLKLPLGCSTLNLPDVNGCA